MKRSLGSRRFLALLIAVAAVVVVVLLVLIGIGVLRLPAPATPSVAVDEVQWHILQGTTSFGFGWFGPSWRNITGEGYPVSVASGETFSMELTVSNLDSVNHTIYSVIAAPPFRVTQYLQGVGHPVTPGSDEWYVTVNVLAPTVSSDSSYELYLTMNALGP
jgi:hypothetical protein